MLDGLLDGELVFHTRLDVGVFHAVYCLRYVPVLASLVHAAVVDDVEDGGLLEALVLVVHVVFLPDSRDESDNCRVVVVSDEFPVDALLHLGLLLFLEYVFVKVALQPFIGEVYHELLHAVLFEHLEALDVQQLDLEVIAVDCVVQFDAVVDAADDLAEEALLEFLAEGIQHEFRFLHLARLVLSDVAHLPLLRRDDLFEILFVNALDLEDFDELLDPTVTAAFNLALVSPVEPDVAHEEDAAADPQDGNHLFDVDVHVGEGLDGVVEVLFECLHLHHVDAVVVYAFLLGFCVLVFDELLLVLDDGVSELFLGVLFFDAEFLS